MNILDKLCELLFMEETDIILFSLTAPHRYKVYSIPKRNSEDRRIIAHPSKELKFIQRLLVDILEEKLPVHDSAYAYREGRSIKDNAKRHLNSKYLLKMDFKDFFPSITPEFFFREVEKVGLDFEKKDKAVLSYFLFWKADRDANLTLSIGAPSSPLISNFVMRSFDKIVEEECKKIGVVYTRYADDITFSTLKKGFLFSVPELVVDVLNKTTDSKIEINKKKTVYSSMAHNRHVTGITLTNDNELSIGREKKRLISSMIHKFSHGLLSDEKANKLQGHISFASYVEPKFYERMEKKYGAEVMKGIRDVQVEASKNKESK